MGDKIKTYTVGLVEGFVPAFQRLDVLFVADLNKRGLDVEIKSVRDKYYIVKGKTSGLVRPGEECLARVIVYREIRK